MGLTLPNLRTRHKKLPIIDIDIYIKQKERMMNKKQSKRNNKIKSIFLSLILLSIIGIITYYTVVVMIARSETPEIINSLYGTGKISLSFSDLTERQLEILLKVEDPEFYNHGGVDLCTPGAGLTTITQGLVKKLYFENFTPGIAKIKQTLIAYFALDPLVNKNKQLEIFLNKVYLGTIDDKPIYGFKEAAAAYYNKDFNELTESEYISLVAMIIAPNRFNIISSPQANQNRSERIKLLVNGEYYPKGLMDLYYGGEYFTEKPYDWLDKMIWGY